MKPQIINVKAMRLARVLPLLVAVCSQSCFMPILAKPSFRDRHPNLFIEVKIEERAGRYYADVRLPYYIPDDVGEIKELAFTISGNPLDQPIDPANPGTIDVLYYGWPQTRIPLRIPAAPTLKPTVPAIGEWLANPAMFLKIRSEEPSGRSELRIRRLTAAGTVANESMHEAYSPNPSIDLSYYEADEYESGDTCRITLRAIETYANQAGLFETERDSVTVYGIPAIQEGRKP